MKIFLVINWSPAGAKSGEFPRGITIKPGNELVTVDFHSDEKKRPGADQKIKHQAIYRNTNRLPVNRQLLTANPLSP